MAAKGPVWHADAVQGTPSVLAAALNALQTQGAASIQVVWCSAISSVAPGLYWQWVIVYTL